MVGRVVVHLCDHNYSYGRIGGVRQSRRLARSAEPMAVGHRRQSTTFKVNFVLAALAQEQDGSIRVEGLPNSLVIVIVVVVIAAVVHRHDRVSFPAFALRLPYLDLGRFLLSSKRNQSSSVNLVQIPEGQN